MGGCDVERDEVNGLVQARIFVVSIHSRLAHADNGTKSRRTIKLKVSTILSYKNLFVLKLLIIGYNKGNDIILILDDIIVIVGRYTLFFFLTNSLLNFPELRLWKVQLEWWEIPDEIFSMICNKTTNVTISKTSPILHTPGTPG